MTEPDDEEKANKEDTEDNIADYLKYIALNVGFDGLFTKRTPREMIEGYEDLHLKKVSKRTLYDGGLADRSAKISMGRLPKKSRVTLLMGNESSNGEADARQVISWTYGNDKDSQDLPYITVPERRWQSPDETTISMVSPQGKNNEISFKGTEGVQFSPNLSASDDKLLSFFASEFASNLELEYNRTNTEWFENLDVLIYDVKPDELNMTKLMGANATVAFEGSYVGIESKTGLPLVWNITAFYSYSLDDALVDESASSTVPLVKVSRNFAWTSNNVHKLLDSSLLSSLRWKWSILAIALGCGVFLGIIGIFLLIRSSKESQRVRRLINVVDDNASSQVAYSRIAD